MDGTTNDVLPGTEPRRAITDDEQPAVIDGLEAVDLDGEIVVFNPTNGQVHQLDRIGSLLWDFLDGTATVAELVDDVAAAFSAPRAAVDADVKAFLAELDFGGLLVGSAHIGEADPVEEPPGPWLADPPFPCAGSADSLPWGAVLAVGVGDRWAGVRLPSAEHAEALAAAWRQDAREDPDAPPNAHLLVAEDRGSFHRLHRHGCLTAVSADPRRILTALARHLGASRPTPPDLARFDVLAVVRDGEATLVPKLLDERLLHHRRRLEEAGVVATDLPHSYLDLRAGELVVPPDDLLDLEAAPTVLDLLGPARRVEPIVEPGRYPIARWLFLDLFSDDEMAELPPPTALRYAVAASRQPDGSSLAALRALIPRLVVQRVNPSYEGSTVDILLQR